jgi:hypothetical protein
MSLFAEPVPLPTEKITYKKGAHGIIYVYRTMRAYRNKQGKPTSDEMSIGKLDPETRMLIPNKNYFTLYGVTEPGPKEPPDIPEPKTLDRGNASALEDIAGQIGLTDALKTNFGERWRQLLAAACYMLCEGNVMAYLSDWFETTEVPFSSPFSDERGSELFASLTYPQRMKFFKDWIGLHTHETHLVYDVTSISTEAKGISQTEFGYNRDHEDLPQINLGMYYGASSRLPVYYNTYSGSVNDASALVFMLRGATALGISSVCFVMDRGFVDEPNLRYMASHGFPFIAPLPSGRNEAVALFTELGGQVRTPSNWIEGKDLYGMKAERVICGVPVEAHIFFDSGKRADDEKAIFSRVAKLEGELKELKEKNEKARLPKRYTDFFDITGSSVKGMAEMSFARSEDKIERALELAGFFVILTTDSTLSPAKVLQIYRERDVIEKNFAQMKGDVEFHRLRTHQDATTDGKIFTGFLALIIRAVALHRLKDDKRTEGVTFEKALRELRKIKLFDFGDGRKIVSTLTKLQKTLLSALGVDLAKIVKP